MHKDGVWLEFINASYGRKHNTAVGAFKKCWLVFDCNEVSNFVSSKVQLNKLCVSCLKERE